MSKKRYRVVVPVETCSGEQFWSVDANSPKEAIEAVRKGSGEFISEEVVAISIDFENAEAFLRE
ncbi:MAG: hypothetical protein GWP08_13905 [Nitrospiraceae bacterium]|nr:hypothetical protein [Nitrospiraceae bacterium]